MSDATAPTQPRDTGAGGPGHANRRRADAGPATARGARVPGGAAGRWRRRALSIYWRMLVINAVILVLAATLLALTPITVSFPLRTKQAIVLAGGLLLSVAANGALLRLGLAPLERLKAAMQRADVLRPGERLPTDSGVGELNELAGTFNDMLSRLEEERRLSASRAWMAEEAERRRISRDLHDEVGQRLTAVLLFLRRSAAEAGEPTRSELVEAQSAIRDALDEVRRVLRRLRPEVLDELGLVSALSELATGFSASTGLRIDRRLAHDPPRMASETELAVYRIAQEALTNVARHADAAAATLTLDVEGSTVTLRVVDDGRGIGGDVEAGGIRGMRERAIQIGGTVTLTAGAGGGTEVRLVAPVTSPDR
jgi:two-component system, NarL family, sensor histidine kinase UhpB